MLSARMPIQQKFTDKPLVAINAGKFSSLGVSLGYVDD